MKPTLTLAFILFLFSTLAISTPAGDKKSPLMVPPSVQKAQKAKAPLAPATNQPSSSNNNPPPAQNPPPAKKPKTDAPPSQDAHLDKAAAAFHVLAQHTEMNAGPLYHPTPNISPAQQETARNMQVANSVVQSGVQVAKDQRKDLDDAKARKQATQESLKKFKATGDIFSKRRRALRELKTLRALKRNNRNRRWSDM